MNPTAAHHPDQNFHSWMWLLTLFGALLLLRLLFLGADPPFDVHAHFITDEGWWAHNARQRYLFGEWVMDEFNSSLVGAPLTSLSLLFSYQAFGLGLAQTRLVQALAGFLTCVVLYAFLRRVGARRAAWIGTALIGFHYFILTNNRVGFVESLQLLFLTSCAVSAVLALDRPGWGLASGVCFTLAVLAKISAVGFLAVLALFWAAVLLRRNAGDAVPPRQVWTGIGLFVLSMTAVSTVVYVVWVSPHLTLVGRDLGNHLNQAAAGRSPLNYLMFAFDHHVSRPNALALQSPLLLLGSAAMLGGWLLRSRRVELDGCQLMMLCWIVGSFLTFGNQGFVPERRYLQLVPPLAVLVALHLASGPIVTPTRLDLRTAPAWVRALLGLLLGVLVAVFARIPPLVAPVADALVAGGLVVEGEDAIRLAGITILSIGALLGVVAGVAVPALLPRTAFRVRAGTFLTVFLLFHVGRFAYASLPPTFTMRDAANEIESRAALPAEGTWSAEGDAAGTLLLSSEAFTYHVRRWDHWSIQINVGARDRFHPAVLIGDGTGGSPDFALDICRDIRGAPRFRIPVRRVRVGG